MPRVIAQRIDTSKPAMHTRCAWLGAGASDIRPEHRHHRPATHTCCASHLPAEMAGMLELECDCTPHCPHSPHAMLGGVMQKDCHLQGRQSSNLIWQLPKSIMDALPTAQCRRKACPL